VERPGVGGGLATLTNYIASAWPVGYAWIYMASSQTYYYEDQNPAAGTLEMITMLDNNGNEISSAAVQNNDSLCSMISGRLIDPNLTAAATNNIWVRTRAISNPT
jgi:hypothetical protein